MSTLFIVITIFLSVLLVVSVVSYCKEKTLQDIRLDVYTLFLQAEKKYYESGQGEQKMKWVVSKARSLLPPWLQLVMTEDVFIKLIQIWFNGIKDLLDDGKINNNIKA